MDNKYLKAVLLLIWFLVAANLFVPTPEWLDQLLKVLGIFLIVAHALECFIFRRKIIANSRPPIKGFAMVFLFGVVHLNSLPDYEQ